MVVIIIIALVASIGTGAYQNQRQQVIYNDSVLKVLSMIKTARNYAISSRPVYDECEVGNESYIPEAGYGVYLYRDDDPDESRIVLFANNETDDAVEANQYDEETDKCDSDLMIEEYALHEGTVFEDLLIALAPVEEQLSSNSQDPEDELVILFRPPLADAAMFANDRPLNDTLLTQVDDIYMEFRRIGVPTEVPSTYIHMNRVAGFPEVSK